MKNLLTRPLTIALLALVLGGSAFFVWQKNGTLSPEQRYKLQETVVGDVTQNVSANGTLSPVTLVNVGTQVSGTVKKLHVDFNDVVKAGQVLAELDDSILVAAAGQSEANIASAIASLDLARANEARIKSLFEQEYVSRQELDQSVQARKAAEASLRLARAQNDRDRANLGYSVIRSPVSGVVVDRQIDLGQTVAASFQTPVLFKIAQDLAQMQIYTSFAEADIGNIRVDQPVRFTVDAFPNRSFKGKVKQLRLNPTTTQNVVTYNVVVEVENPDQVLLPGMTAYVSIVVAEKKEVLTVANAALRYRPAGEAGKGDGNKDAARGAGERAAGTGGNGGAPGAAGARGKRRDSGSGTVYVLADGQIKPVAVNLGITDNRNTEVTGGDLKAGDRVVLGENLPNVEPASGTGVRMRMF
ncbi:MAG: HlyD family secretion protein [Pseudomonadota bacterium]|nr:HlyD family secretion protein [Pseudomonadota bacterium]MDQ5881468.1 HlyD family secretion protein [Pseudomonadota bacterium]MDQ5905371.1 HlyD family secretion protein [Pseudomonadota bacterium]MDQ5942480.1 HlyD family secretion protein [Pseudomonadota bacterium]MDQ5944871.1 HlyD family secretion protein [Pseudomonadota bacterium]